MLSTTAARATDWYILDVKNDRCRLATEVAKETKVPSMASPGTAANAATFEGQTPDVRTIRNEAGETAAVSVTAYGTLNIWFPTESYCLKGKAAFEQGGVIKSP